MQASRPRSDAGSAKIELKASEIRSRVSLRGRSRSMVESASCASASPGEPASSWREEGSGAPSAARAGGLPDVAGPGMAAGGRWWRLACRRHGCTALGRLRTVSTRCSTDRRTRHRRPDCQQEARETLGRSARGAASDRGRSCHGLTWIGLLVWFWQNVPEPRGPRVNVCLNAGLVFFFFLLTGLRYRRRCCVATTGFTE